MNFAFLVHPLGNETDRVLTYIREVDLPKSFGWDMFSFIHDMHVAMMHADGEGSTLSKEVQVIDELPALISRLGARTDGRLYEIPMDSFTILQEPDRDPEYILAAVDLAADWGAKIVGLRSMTGIGGGQGSYVAEHAPISVTTGNSLTVYAAVENLIHACDAVEIELSSTDIVVVGVPGSIAKTMKRKCAATHGHPERSEGSDPLFVEILHCVRDDAFESPCSSHQEFAILAKVCSGPTGGFHHHSDRECPVLARDSSRLTRGRHLHLILRAGAGRKPPRSDRVI
jgi:hypothetical protein